MLKFLNSTGKRIKILRTDLGLSQPALVTAVQQGGASLSQSSLSRIESDDLSPDGRVVAVMAKLFGTTSDYLLMLTDSPLLPEEEIKLLNERSIPYQTTDSKSIRLVRRFVTLFAKLTERDQMILLRMAETMADADQPHIVGEESEDENP